MPLTQTRWPTFAALVVGTALVAAFFWLFLSNPSGEAIPATGGRYIEGVTRPPERINPLFAYANPTDADLSALIFSGLVRLGPDGTPLPDLAARWEITNNGQRYVFHLRRGVVWHDGEEFDANDVAFTYRAMSAPGFTGDPSLAQLMQGVVVSARDPLTVEFQLEQTFGPFLSFLTVGILPEHLLSDVEPARLLNAPFNLAPIGTGPYRLSARDQQGNTKLQRNAVFYLGPPRIADVEFRMFGTVRELTDAVRSQEIDGALYDEQAPGETLDFFVGDDRWTASPLPAAPYYVLYLDTRAPMFNDREVRTALFQGINRSSLLADVAANRGVVAGTGVPDGAWAESTAEFPPFSPGVAAATLEVEGFFRGRDGTRSNSSNVRLAFTLATSDEPRHVAVAENIAAQLRQIGVTVEVEPHPASTFIQERLVNRDYEAALVIVNPGVDPDPYPFWHSSQIPPPGLNLANYRDPRIDDAIERGRQTTDVGRRRDLYQLFDGYFIAAMPSIPLYAPSFMYVQASAIQGFEPRLLFRPSDRFAGIHEWYVRTRVDN